MMKGNTKEDEYENKKTIKLEKNGTAQEEGIRAVERRKYKMRNKKSICRKLEKVWNCENYVENGKEKTGKDKKQRTEDEK